MALTFFPFQEGDTLTAAILNELVVAIQDGSIFTSTSFVGDLVTALDARVDVLEDKVDVLESTIAQKTQREQFVLTATQSIINLSKTPALDGEQLFLNGLALSRSGLPELSDVRDYSISGSLITLEQALAITIQDGDFIVVVYQFEAII